MAAVLAMKSMALCVDLHHCSAPLDILAGASRATNFVLIILVEVEVRMGWSPRPQPLIAPRQDGRILLAVASHGPPRLRIALYTATPENRARIGNLPSLPQIAADIIKLIAVKFEYPSGDFQRVNRLEGAWRLKAIDDQATVDFLDVESVAVMSADDIRLIQKRMKNATQILIVKFAAFVARKIRQAARLDRLFMRPFITEHQDEGVALHPYGPSIGRPH